MIVRRRALSEEKDSVSMNITYYRYHVLAMLREMFQQNIPVEGTVNEVFTYKFTEFDFIRFFECTHFRYFNKAFRRTLAKWALDVAIRYGYIIKEEDDKHRCYFFAPTCQRPNGRPRKEVDEWAEFDRLEAEKEQQEDSSDIDD